VRLKTAFRGKNPVELVQRAPLSRLNESLSGERPGGADRRGRKGTTLALAGSRATPRGSKLAELFPEKLERLQRAGIRDVSVVLGEHPVEQPHELVAVEDHIALATPTTHFENRAPTDTAPSSARLAGLPSDCSRRAFYRESTLYGRDGMVGHLVYFLLPLPSMARKLHLAYRCGEPGESLFTTEKLDPYDVFAALCAVGCPRLAFLLTDFDPRDPLDEELAKRKLWVYWAGKFYVPERGRTELFGDRWGMMVDTEVLCSVPDEALAKMRERARAGSTGYAAELAVKLEMARFAELADAGFPDLVRIFDRYVDVLGELGIGYSYLPPGEERRISALVRVYRSDQVPREVKERGAEHLYHVLKNLARLLLPVYYSHILGYVVAHSA